MKKSLKYLSLVIIMVFSFYYTNKAALLAKNTNPIMKSINECKEDLSVSSINATILDDYIIPGINGLEVNVDKSFNKMRPYHIFNKYYLIYDQVKPKISLEDNKDKIIINGNKNKKEISIIIEDNKMQKEILNSKNIDYDILTTLNNYGNDKERINNESSKYKELDNTLDKDNINTKICLIDSNINIEYCKKNSYYLVKAKKITKSNYISMKSMISNGSIIWISNELSKDELEIIIKYIQSKDLHFVYLSKLIDETNEK